MARVKSEKMFENITLAAEALFEKHGYIGTTISRIAKEAGTAPSNVYVYYPSKIEIAFAVFDPWLRERISELEERVASCAGVREQLTTLVEGLLSDIAGDESGRTLTLVQALATARKTDEYSPALLHWTEERILGMIARALPDGDPELLRSLAHVLMLAFDGVALRQNLRRSKEGEDYVVQSILNLLFFTLTSSRPPVRKNAGGTARSDDPS